MYLACILGSIGGVPDDLGDANSLGGHSSDHKETGSATKQGCKWASSDSGDGLDATPDQEL
eukprot:14633-Rhodomonas_salina.2